MIRCALALTRSPETSTPLARSPSISSLSTRGSTTTPLPITHSLPGWRIPDGMRWKAHFSPSRTIVWPALLPPWKRITRSAFSARRSMTLPLPRRPTGRPRSPCRTCRQGSLRSERTRPRGAVGERLGAGESGLRPHAPVGAEQRQRTPAHLHEPGNGALADLLAQRGRLEVRRDHDGAAVLVARVDDRVELLEHPRRARPRADVVDVQHLDGGEPVEQRRQRGLRPLVEAL